MNVFGIYLMLLYYSCKMSLLSYFKDALPNPIDTLPAEVPSSAIAIIYSANRVVGKELCKLKPEEVCVVVAM